MMIQKKSPPPPARGTQAPPPAAIGRATESREFAITSGRIDGPQKVVLYGPGGVGKSTLAALAPNPVFIDVEGGTNEIDVHRVESSMVERFSDVRELLHGKQLDGFSTIVIDSGTKIQEMIGEHVLATIPHEKGHMVKRLQDYGFSKHLHHIYDTFLLLLADLDSRARKGQHIIVVCHECVNTVPNPTGEDFIRYEPRLQDPSSGQNSVRSRIKEWAGHVLFLGYDVLAKDGKGTGAGTRTIYTFELPSHMAKSRTTREALPFTGPEDGSIWDMIFNLGGARDE